MENKLILKTIGEKFTNRTGYPSRKVTFFDPTSKIEKQIYLHRGHAGDYGIWRKIEKNGYDSLFYGEIKIIPITEILIRTVRAYKNSEILDYKTMGVFIIFKYRGASEGRNLDMALKNQIWQYVKSKNELFDLEELPDED